MNSEQQIILENGLRSELERGLISRRQFMQAMIMVGLGVAGVGALGAPSLAALAQDRPLTPSFYQWIYDNHPLVSEFNKSYKDLNAQIAPVAGFDVSRFVAEGKAQQSTWDVYVGMTPFVEMVSLIKADVIEPWDKYIPKDVIDDIIPSIRAECTFDGKLYSWPFLLDIIVEGYNSTITTKAGIPDKPPLDWDEYLANSQTVLDKGAARYGCTFDSNGWRSLAPITHSISTDVYYNLPGDPLPLYDFTNDASIQALQIMKKMLDLSSANALQPGTSDGGVNNTPDEIAFGSQAVAYYVKYQNSPLRFSAKWPDPTALRLAALPKAKGGVGSTVFWTTGAGLFKWGKNKEKAAEYMVALTHEAKIWQDSISGKTRPGQLPPYKSIYAGWDKSTPDWLKANPWVGLIRAQLDVAKAIPNHAYSLSQFQIAKSLWEKYLTGEEKDPKAAMQAAKDAVAAEIKKAG